MILNHLSHNARNVMLFQLPERWTPRFKLEDHYLFGCLTVGLFRQKDNTVICLTSVATWETSSKGIWGLHEWKCFPFHRGYTDTYILLPKGTWGKRKKFLVLSQNVLLYNTSPTFLCTPLLVLVFLLSWPLWDMWQGLHEYKKQTKNTNKTWLWTKGDVRVLRQRIELT